MSSLLLTISSEKASLDEELQLLNRIFYKLNNQLRHFKQLNNLPLLFKKVRQFINILHPIQQATLDILNSLKLEPFLKAHGQLQTLLIKKGHQIKQLLKNGVFLSFSVLVLGCMAKIKVNLDRIQSKLRALDRIIKEFSKKQQKALCQIGQ